MRSRHGGLMWEARGHRFDCETRTHVVGILNVTPDSFSDGGRFFDPEIAVAAGVEMAEEGADIIDIGGESTRPGADPVKSSEELDRVIPVIKRLSAEVDVPLSIDTSKAEVAAGALGAGASIVNDVSAGSDPKMFDVVRDAGAGVVIMHSRGGPKTMQQLTDYEDVVGEVRSYLSERLDAAIESGIEATRVVIDPGLGFAKTQEQNLLVMKEISAFASLGRPVLVGPSRKSFIGKVIHADVDDRVEGTAGAVAWLAARGAHFVRVHDVRAMVRVVRVVDAIRSADAAVPTRAERA
ncbi:MAG TPA: dihydropteroate synthase [Actinomycetota bacterium]